MSRTGYASSKAAWAITAAPERVRAWARARAPERALAPAQARVRARAQASNPVPREPPRVPRPPEAEAAHAVVERAAIKFVLMKITRAPHSTWGAFYFCAFCASLWPFPPAPMLG